MADAHERPLTGIARFLRRVPRQSRAHAVIEAILSAADQSLDAAEHGPLAPLLARAGVAVGSFYEYFGSREALLGAVIERGAQRNFQMFLADIDAASAGAPSFEEAIRRSADVLVRRYLDSPAYFLSVVRLADRFGLLPHIGRERDRFAGALATRAERFTPELAPAARTAMMRAAADALTGIVLVAAVRDPVPPFDEVSQAAGDVAWGVIDVHLTRARGVSPADG